MPSHPRTRRLLAATMAAGLLLGACSDDDGDDADTELEQEGEQLEQEAEDGADEVEQQVDEGAEEDGEE